MKYEAIVDFRNEMKNAASINSRSTATVEMTAPKINEMLNDQTSNKKIEMLNNQASKEKEVKKMPQSITNSEPITHEKSNREHIMKLNQSDETQQNPSLNNSHLSRQIDSGGGEDQFIKASNSNDDLKGRFTKALNDNLNKHKKSLITNQKEVENSHRKIHHKNSNRTEKA